MYNVTPYEKGKIKKPTKYTINRPKEMVEISAL